MWSGDHDGALSLAQRVMETAGDDVARYSEGAHVATAIHVRCARWDDAEHLLAEWEPRVPQTPPNRLTFGYECLRAHLAIGRGDPGDALVRLRSRDAAVQQTGSLLAPVNLGDWLWPHVEAACALLHRGELAPARRAEAVGWAKTIANQTPAFMHPIGHRALAALDPSGAHVSAALEQSAAGTVPYVRYLALEAAVASGEKKWSAELSAISQKHGFMPPWTRD